LLARCAPRGARRSRPQVGGRDPRSAAGAEPRSRQDHRHGDARPPRGGARQAEAPSREGRAGAGGPGGGGAGMKFFLIVWRNLLRRKFRTIFTIGAVLFAFMLFGVLWAIRAVFSMGVGMAGQSRLMVIDKVSIITPLPASYMNQIRMVPGVTDITFANWFGGYYQDVRNQFPTFATD